MIVLGFIAAVVAVILAGVIAPLSGVFAAGMAFLGVLFLASAWLMLAEKRRIAARHAY